jgi:radical SAM-linked protein
MKLYFMIGLPTETDEDVAGIAQTGGRLKRLGKKIRRDADVTVSVSTHVPKPHTPFQWCQMDSVPETLRKQRMLRDLAEEERIDLKWHEAAISHVEGIFSRGDRKLADLIEHAWRAGARFDGWDEHFDFARWQRSIAACGIDPELYLRTRPVDARLPWDHLDIGLEDGFLAWEYRRALKDRVSPPCGKPNKTLLHHTNIEDAEADQRKLVCFDCGIACDMTQMREERIVYLRTLDARKDKPNTTPSAKRVSVDGRPLGRADQPQPVGFDQAEGSRFRLRFAKRGRAAFISHLDMMRLLIRVFRRAGVEMIYSKGYHPKPQLTFAPALGLGIASLGELCDVRVVWDRDPSELHAALRAATPEGLEVLEVTRLEPTDPSLSKLLTHADYAAFVPAQVSSLRSENMTVSRIQKRKLKTIDVAKYLVNAQVSTDASLARSLEWPSDGTLIIWRVTVGDDGGAKPLEVVHALLGGEPPPGTRYARLSLLLDDAQRGALIPVVGESALPGGE